MDITQWYAVALGGVMALFIAACILLTITKLARTYASFLFMKHVFHRQIPQQLRGSAKTTWFDVVLIGAFSIGNILCTTVNVEDVSDLARRTGLMSIVNLVPLSLGPQMNLIADSCGISHDAFSRTHRYLGRLAIVEGFIHMVIVVSLREPDLRGKQDIAGLTVGSITDE
jgi:hypothetical protein